MSLQSWSETLVTAQVDGTQILNSTTQASIIPAAAKFTLPANFFSIGKKLRITASGRVSNVVTTPGTLLFQVLFGATAVFNSGNATIALNTTAKTDVTWDLLIDMTCRAIGASANLMTTLKWTSESVVGAASGTTLTAFIPASAPAVGSNFDSTTAQVVDLQAKFSVATATTAMTLHEYSLEALN
jgi:hypothetical protein